MEEYKVLMLNGSPHKEGSTYTALSTVGEALLASGVGYEIINVGTAPHRGCTVCLGCKSGGGCVIRDGVAEIGERLAAADGLIIASPVYYASPNGNLISFLDRLFFSTKHIDKRMKVGASVVSARRGGCTASFDALNKYFTISGMPIASSSYWNMIHGTSREEALRDAEGLSVMRTLGENMAYLIKAISHYKATEKERG